MDIPFKTTPEQRREIPSVVSAMHAACVEPTLIAAAAELAQTDQGVFDLLKLWLRAVGQERDEIIGDIRESLADYRRE
jgi:hypothetical protein